MRLKRVEIVEYRSFENIIINFDRSSYSDIYSIASKNGGGKSTLLQFIFIMLHSFIDSERKVYLQNLLDDFSDITDELEFVKFVIEDSGDSYELDFYITQDNNPQEDYQLYLDLQSIDKKLKKLPRLEMLDSYIDISDDVDVELKLKSEIGKLRVMYQDKKYRIFQLEKRLKEKNILYITHLKSNKNILLLKTSMANNLLRELTNRVFLSAPSTQMFLFLPKKAREKIFSMHSYCDTISATKDNLSGFYTYDFASVELILEAFNRASSEDVEMKRVTGEYGNEYDRLRDNLKQFLDNKEIKLNREGDRVIFKIEGDDRELLPEDLSHGELKKLGIYMWLINSVKSDSIILMDEVDIALHPKWQYELVDNFSATLDSQFILATHSPQILSSTYYKNLIYIKREDNKTLIRQPNSTFSDNDINTIITLGMDTTHIPPKLERLHFEYRVLVEDGKIDTDRAKELKLQILEWESIDSTFFKRIELYLRFNR